MKIFVCSDVHGNLRALEAVLERYRAHEPCSFLFLGDALGYGAHAGECLERLLAIPRATFIRGNHEAAFLDSRELADMSEFAVASLRLQRRALGDRFDAVLRACFFLTAEFDSCVGAHASPVSPGEWPYIYTPYGAESLFRALDFRVCFIGHTHLPALFSSEKGEIQIAPGETVSLDPGGRSIINPGSVGQPRDGDPRASCLVYDGDEGTVTFERCAYDIEAEVADMTAAGAPPYLAERLLLGI